jgi:hypothetical protein
MLSKQAEQKERHQILDNDRAVREHTTTYLKETHSDLGGRWAINRTDNVVGQTPTIDYGGKPNWAHDPTGVEPPLGYSVDAMAPVGEPFEVERAGQVLANRSPPSADSQQPIKRRKLNV